MRAVDGAKLDALGALAADLGRTVTATGPVRAIRLMRHVDGPGDARLLARVAEASGPRAETAFTVLGKARVIRLATRVSRAGWTAATALGGVLASLAGLALSGLASMGLRGVRRSLRPRRR
jgi:hypothetical protein